MDARDHVFRDERLAALARRVPPGARVADVGADHGRLALGLLAAGRAASCVATERTPQRLARLRASCGPHPPRALELAWGDGFDALAGLVPVDVAVLAGLGARTLVRILERAGDRLPPRLLLQPQTETARLRRWLRDAGWGLAHEELVEERGRLYAVLEAVRPAPPGAWEHAALDAEDLLVAGPRLVERPTPRAIALWRRRRAHWSGLAAASGARRPAEEAARAGRVLRALRMLDSNFRPAPTRTAGPEAQERNAPT